MGIIRTALDSDQLDVFGHPVDFVFTYSDLVHDAATFEAQHKGKQVVYIDRKLGDPGDKASIIDVEFGAYQPHEVPEWYDRKAAAKVPYLTHYSDRNDLPAIHAAIGSRHMWRWVATLDGTIGIAGFVPLQGPDIVQIANQNMLGFHADFNLVLSPSWHPAPLSEHMAAAINAVTVIGHDLASAQQALNALRANIIQA